MSINDYMHSTDPAIADLASQVAAVETQYAAQEISAAEATELTNTITHDFKNLIALVADLDRAQQMADALADICTLVSIAKSI